MRRSRSLIVTPILIVMLLLTACGGAATPTPTVIPAGAGESGLQISVQFDPDPAVTGTSALIVTITGADGSPAAGLAVAARGDMTHAGMAPQLGEGVEGEPGVYTIPWEWTMAGDWLLDVTARAADGSETTQTLDVAVEG